MEFLSFFLSSEEITTTATTVTKGAGLFAATLAYGTATLTRKQWRTLKWQAFKTIVKNKFRFRKPKADGATIFLLLLLLVACGVVLWILWELGGIFALILGIVFGLGLLSLLLRTG